eukprot:Colp12_sorted_trinity150504_noHs@3293
MLNVSCHSTECLEKMPSFQLRTAFELYPVQRIPLSKRPLSITKVDKYVAASLKADRRLEKAVLRLDAALTCEESSNDDCHRMERLVRDHQKNFLQELYKLSRNMTSRGCIQLEDRSYRRCFPPEVCNQVAGQYCEQIVYTAEVLCCQAVADSTLVQDNSRRLVAAKILKASFQAVRNTLKLQRRDTGKGTPLAECLAEFDKSYVLFERELFSSYIEDGSDYFFTRRAEEELVHAMDDSVKWALAESMLGASSIEDCDPLVLIALPRLALAWFLRKSEKDNDEVVKMVSYFFKPKVCGEAVLRLRTVVQSLDDQAFKALAQALIHGLSEGDLCSKELYLEITNYAECATCNSQVMSIVEEFYSML